MPNETNADTLALPLTQAYPFLASAGLGNEAEVIRASKDQLGSYTTTLKRARIISLLTSNNLLDQFVTNHWHFGATDKGKREIKRLVNIYDRWIKTGGKDIDEGDNSDEDAGTEFALETHLRDYLAENLAALEPGMTLWPVGQDQDAVEFSVDKNNHRIDILARDSAGTPTVIELKVSRGYEKTIGQTLYYRTKIKEMLKVGKVRIIIVAREISPELKAATADLPDVSLFEYRLTMSLTKL
jgi:hypothetical protein